MKKNGTENFQLCNSMFDKILPFRFEMPRIKTSVRRKVTVLPKRVSESVVKLIHIHNLYGRDSHGNDS